MDSTVHYFLLILIPVLIQFNECVEDNNSFDGKDSAQSSLKILDGNRNSPPKSPSAATKKRQLYLKRFSQSWKLYARANDIAKREKLRKALIDALKSMETKKKSTMSTLTHDTVYRIKHAASMLKEFKRMYQLSKDVMESWKDYQTARKSLVTIGKTEEGENLLKRYVILRNSLSKHYKRTMIAKPTIVDDSNIDDLKPKMKQGVLVVKDQIGGRNAKSRAKTLQGKNVATPGTLQIIRFTDVEAGKGNDVTENKVRADGLADARAAYLKAKEKVQAANKGDIEEESNNKKSVLVKGDDAVKQEAMGHVSNSQMSISSLIKKAENEDLQSATGNQATNNGNQYGDTAILQAGKAIATKEQSYVSGIPTTNIIGNVAPSNSPSNNSTGSPTTSLTSVMDSLTEVEDNLARPTNHQHGSQSVGANPVSATANPVQSSASIAASHEQAPSATAIPVSAAANPVQSAASIAASHEQAPSATSPVKSAAPIAPPHKEASSTTANPVAAAASPVQSAASIAASHEQTPSATANPVSSAASPMQSAASIAASHEQAPSATANPVSAAASPLQSAASIAASPGQATSAAASPVVPAASPVQSAAPIAAPQVQVANQVASVNTQTPVQAQVNPIDSKTVEALNRSNNVSTTQNLNSNQTTTTQPTESASKTTASSVSQPDVDLKMIYTATTLKDNKQIEIKNQPLANVASNATENVKAFQDISQMVAMPIDVPAIKKFHLNETAIQAEVVKTVDRQLETLKRLQEAKRARRKFDTAKRELQSKIKKLYDMAVTFEKPKNETESTELHTKAFISPLPTDNDNTKDLHPGVALAGINDKAISPVQTPSDDGEHHGFTLGGLDSGKSSAHIVDLQEQDDGGKIEKVFQLKLPGDAAASINAVRKSENGPNDKALKSLTEAIENDLEQIEQNEAKRKSEKKRNDALKNVFKPLVQAFAQQKEKHLNGEVKEVEEPAAKTGVTETPTNKMADKKSESTNENNDKTTVQENVASKAQDAFKEVEDYLSKALKHVAKEAVAEEVGPTKDSNDNEDTKSEDKQKDTKEKEKPKVDKDGDTKIKADTQKEKTTNEDNKKKDSTKDDKLLRIVEDAMKEHSRDPTSPHPINSELLHKLSSKQTETPAKAADAEPEKSVANLVKETTNNTADKGSEDEKKSESKETATKSEPVSSSNTEHSPNAKQDHDAIDKAEHLEEEAAKLQEKLYSQGTPNDAYSSIEPQKPMFSKNDEETPEYQQTYKEPVYHHRHKHHHRNYDERQDDDDGESYEDNNNDDDDDDDEDDEADSRSNDGDDDDEDYDDDTNRKRKKSYLQSLSMRHYRNFQRDLVASHQSPAQPPQMMNRGMMGNEGEDNHEELEDSKKSYVPKSMSNKATDENNSLTKTIKPDFMYTL